MNGKNWLVWSNEHSAWWGPDRQQHFTSGNSAGRYTLQDALAICRTRNGAPEPGKMPSEIIHPAAEFLERLLRSPDGEIVDAGMDRAKIEADVIERLEKGFRGDTAGVYPDWIYEARDGAKIWPAEIIACVMFEGDGLAIPDFLQLAHTAYLKAVPLAVEMRNLAHGISDSPADSEGGSHD